MDSRGYLWIAPRRAPKCNRSTVFYSRPHSCSSGSASQILFPTSPQCAHDVDAHLFIFILAVRAGSKTQHTPSLRFLCPTIAQRPTRAAARARRKISSRSSCCLSSCSVLSSAILYICVPSFAPSSFFFLVFFLPPFASPRRVVAYLPP